MQNRKVVLFDGKCGLCNRMISFIKSHNSKKNLYFAFLQSNYSKKYLKIGSDNILDLKTIIFIDGIKIYTKSQAIIMILKNMDGIYPRLTKIFTLIPPSFLDSFYNLVAINRYRIFKKQNECNLHSSNENFLFLD